ncbi:MAG: FkbM family methyltransferase [Mucilaginibacter sp.]|nr:FkbM family methyltransferase [Mucilaginibacter sp.]
MDKIKRTLGFIFTHPLGKRHPFKSLLRFVVWQLQSMISPAKLISKSFIKPVRFYACKGLTGITGNIYVGLHEFNDMAFLLHFLRTDDYFFDIGANVGSYSLLASGVCNAKSITIEPVVSTFELLTQNIALNQLEHKVRLINSGAGAEMGMISFSCAEDTTNHVISENEAGIANIKASVITIDSLLTDGQPLLIKIDVEGYETEVLKGMKETLSTSSLKAIIIELNGSGSRYGFDEKNIHELLMLNNFKPYNYDPFTRLLTELPLYGDYNTIYCRDLDFVNNRLEHATGIKIMGELI